MEIAFLVIAVIGLLALTGGGSVRGGVNVTPGGQIPPQPPQPPATPWQPSVPAPVGPPMVPSQTSNMTGQLFTGSAQIGTAVAQQSVKTGTVSPLGGVAIAAGIGVAVGIITSLIQAHEARLHGATNENNAVDQYVPVFDSFVKALVQGYNAKQYSAAQAAQAAQQFDRYIYNAFRGLVGAPGTSWNDQIGMSGQCNKSCTVGCCLYFGDLGPVLNNISFVLGFPTGKWGAGDPRISGRTIQVPKVYPSHYSRFTRELYTITLN